MKLKVSLRMAAVLMLLHTFGHTIGALTWKQAPNARVAAVISGMQTEQFAFMGKSISLGGFFDGYGFIMIGVLLLITVQLWQVAGEPNRRQILPIALLLLFMGICELIWFFPFAAAFSLTAALCTLYAYVKSPVWKHSH